MRKHGENNLTMIAASETVPSTGIAPVGGGGVVDPHLHPFRNVRPKKHDAREESQSGES